MKQRTRKTRNYTPRPIRPPTFSVTDMLITAHGETMEPIEAARLIGVSRWTVYRYRDTGLVMPAAGGRRVLTRSVAALIENQGAMR